MLSDELSNFSPLRKLLTRVFSQIPPSVEEEIVIPLYPWLATLFLVIEKSDEIEIEMPSK